ncbi:MAG: hypothetical protein A2162_03100 [Deltaproteobacteria bacterium RBG_13_52_11b]|nr:MAG: hypothetical protein A2162_03100 [Deltaproteobacteria bacterium RBG_13_52_11b]
MRLLHHIFGPPGRSPAGDVLEATSLKEIKESSTDASPAALQAKDDFYNEFSLVFSALAAMLFLLLLFFLFSPALASFFS